MREAYKLIFGSHSLYAWNKNKNHTDLSFSCFVLFFLFLCPGPVEITVGFLYHHGKRRKDLTVTKPAQRKDSHSHTHADTHNKQMMLPKMNPSMVTLCGTAGDLP